MKVRTKFKETEIGMIPEDWEVKSISELSEISLGGTPSTTVKEYWDGKIKWASAKDISNAKGRYVYDTERRITEEGIANSAAKILPKNTIIITSRGTVGEMAMLSEPMSFNQTCYGFRAKTVNEIYLYYRLKSAINHLKKVSYGTVFNTITMRTFDEIKLAIPTSENEQSSIAKILSDLDSKIELNQQMNATLESIGQALFKHWFIDFEFPNEKGKPYKSNGGEMVNSDLGEIPNGWTVGRLGDLVHVEIGGDWGQNERFEGSVQTICLRGVDLQNLKEKGYSSDAPQRWIKKSSLEKRSISDCDILIGASGLGPVGRSLYCSDSLQHLYEFPLTYSNFCKRLGAISSDYAVYLEKLLEDIYLSGDMQNYITGTSVPNLDINGLLNRQIIIPDEELVIKYSNYAKNRFRKLFNKENIILSRIRDSLLPKLMSGQIRVPAG